MDIKIFHTADLHIGMKFKGYPDDIRDLLQEGRINALKNMVYLANEEKANLLVIAGDLFDRIIGIDKRSIKNVAESLEEFNGECIIIMPGNHDYDNDMVELWNAFNNIASDKILCVNKEKPYSLRDYGLEIVIYPAPCHKKHSNTNNIGWIKDEILDESQLNIGIGHGALGGVSPDLDNNYYNMSMDELHSIPLDLWLLGHTHITYPFQAEVFGDKIYNPGTPEPDGLDCTHEGHAWLITVSDKKKVSARRIITGTYKFKDITYEIKDIEDLDRMNKEVTSHNPNKSVVRINLKGRVNQEVYQYRQAIYRSIEKEVLYLLIEDDDLKIQITSDKIHQEFLDRSFPQKLLLSLSDDEDTLQMAYELIMEVRQ